MQKAAEPAHVCGGFNRDHIPASFGEPRRIPAGTRADVEYRTRPLRNEVEHRRVDVFECNALKPCGELRESAVVRLVRIA